MESSDSIDFTMKHLTLHPALFPETEKARRSELFLYWLEMLDYWPAARAIPNIDRQIPPSNELTFGVLWTLTCSMGSDSIDFTVKHLTLHPALFPETKKARRSELFLYWLEMLDYWPAARAIPNIDRQIPPSNELTFGVLWTLTRFVQTHFLTLNSTCITSQEPCFTHGAV